MPGGKRFGPGMAEAGRSEIVKSSMKGRMTLLGAACFATVGALATLMALHGVHASESPGRSGSDAASRPQESLAIPDGDGRTPEEGKRAGDRPPRR